MKRTLALFMAMILCISLSACGKGSLRKDTSDDGIEETDDVDSTPIVDKDHTHSYSAATCDKPATCSCGATKGNALGHRYENGVCKTCGKVDSNYTIQYTVNYEANGGWGETVSSTHISNEARALSKNGFKRAGYSFVGWSTTADAVSATYTDKQNVKNLASQNNQIVTLYAVWKEIRTSSFEDCLKTNASKEFTYHQDAMDNMGKEHTDVALLSEDAQENYEERFVVGLFSRISGTVYVREDEHTSEENSYLEIYGDGKLLYSSDHSLGQYSPSQTFNVDISGINVLKIYKRSTGYTWTASVNLFIENLTLTR